MRALQVLPYKNVGNVSSITKADFLNYQDSLEML